MLRILCGILNNFNHGNTYNIIKNPVSVISVRFRRKPRWLPVAKSKMFRVQERKIVPLDEKLESMRLWNNYRAQMKSLRSFFVADYKQKQNVTSSDHIVLTPEQEEAEFAKIKALNDEWNFEISKIRNERLEQESAAKRELVLHRLQAREKFEKERLAVLEANVQKELENAKTFITSENIDKAIEECLANPVDYNFSIDLKGNIYKGRNADPTKAELK